MITVSESAARLGTIQVRLDRAGPLAEMLVRLLVVALLTCSLGWSQAATPTPAGASPPTPASPQGSAQNAPEITSHDEVTTFKVKVNLVEVRVVVRDAKGNAIGNLKQEDFQLFDNGKLQSISKFSVEKPMARATLHREGVPPISEEATVQSAVIPQNFIAYLFDDVHVEFSDLAQARNAAKKQIQAMQPEDRAAIFTTSGQTHLDFTGNREDLIAALDKVVPHSLLGSLTECPNISYYQADLIINKNDFQATQVAMQDAIDCMSGDQSSIRNVDQNSIRAYAHRSLSVGDDEVRLALGTLNDVVHRIAAMPGTRTIILVSPGFMNKDELQRQTEIAERALHMNVVINTLDARGLFTNMPDASQQRSPSATIAGQVLQYKIAEQDADEDIMAELAYTTGGIFFHNNNDLNEGFRRLASPPEVSYLLGFSPQNLKLDGHYHKLKVTLKPPANGSLQARRGYYAPKGPSDASEQAKQDIEDAVFSREEVRDIPVELHTQFFKANQDDVKLSVVARVDVRHIHFRKDSGRNNNDVTVVYALFDNDGNFISGSQKVLQLHLKDETLDSHLTSGITLKSSFDVKPGSYVVRLVVRGEDGQLAAQNSAVQIP